MKFKPPFHHPHIATNMKIYKDPREKLHVVVGDVLVAGNELPPVILEVFQGGARDAGDYHLITVLPDL